MKYGGSQNLRTLLQIRCIFKKNTISKNSWELKDTTRVNGGTFVIINGR